MSSRKLRLQTTFGWPYLLSPHSSGMVIEDVWPTLFFGAERLPEIRRKVQTLSWAARSLEQMQREAETVISSPPFLPIERIGWRHEFYSHRTAEHLLFDVNSPDHFFDPADGALHHSQAQHRAWILLAHERTYRLMRSLAILYRLTDEERYARWVADGMKKSVEMFSRTDLREGNQEDALYFHPLYDAQVLMLLANSYELTRGSGSYSQRDHTAIVRGIFDSGISCLIRFLEKAGVHNITCYMAAALVTVGSLLDRPEWIAMGLDHPKAGLKALLWGGLRMDVEGKIDGFWFEGSQFYHFYSLCPLICLFEQARLRNHNISELSHLRDRLEKMFEAPVRMADPDGRLPCFGDLGAPKVMKLSSYRHLLEYAAGQIDEGRYAPILCACYARGIPRNNLAALAYGPDELPSVGHRPKPVCLRASGIVIFRAERPVGQYYAWFRCGRHGGGHDHLDKLAVGIHALGEAITPDLGTAGYALRDLKQYYSSTFSHNTLLVDEQDQNRVGRALLEFEAEPLQQAQGVVEDAYDGVLLERRIRFAPPYVLLQDRCASLDPHRYGWVFHAYGSASLQAERQSRLLELPPLPEDGVFAFFTARDQFITEGPVCVDWRVTELVWLRLMVTSDGPFECTFGRTPGNPVPDSRATVLLRAPGRERRFFAALEIHQGSPSLGTIKSTLFDWENSVGKWNLAGHPTATK